MRTIYIDSDYHCHVENAEGRTAVQTDWFDESSDNAIECYLYMPIEDDKAFIQCFDSKRMFALNKQYGDDCENMMSLTDVADLVELVYEDDLGIIG